MYTADTWKKALDLHPHPEGGWFAEIWRGTTTLPASALPRHGGERSTGTSIYYLLHNNDVSRIHRIRSDEIWHYYDGCGVRLHLFLDDGSHEVALLGLHPEKGERPQVVIPANTWFGAVLMEAHEYSLMGCTVAPGFDFADCEFGTRDAMLQQFPNDVELITMLTP